MSSPVRAPARPDADPRRSHYDDPAAVERAILALDAGRMGAWAWDVADGTVTGDPFVARLLNLDHGAQPWPLGSVFASMHPDDLARVQTEVDRALTTGAPYEVVFRDRITAPDTGEEGLRWLGARGTVTERDADGAALRMIGVNWDATTEVEHEVRLREMASEMDHRIRNAFASLRATVTLGEKTAPGIPEFASVLREQILALAHVHGARVELGEDAPSDGDTTAHTLLRRVLSPWLADADRVALSLGADVALGPFRGAAVATLLSSLVEVACAAGALDRPDGHLTVEAERDGASRLRMVWRMLGAAEPEPRPFAEALLARGVSALQGRVSRERAGRETVLAFDLNVA